ncbi:hypothetical protein D8674_009620 [Pyrus ussuriensis x Pyrus communis]|uniref:Uncharacterized protein n=1 Tax=Pyrus ussuriensis x Pyrus communis TaxID=2448454 RepID=A0A5N5F8G8_9ROSA|nr:hypothetical protein D8674_009620 [Pyrus ussuriensis x Pyrus communis]
MATPEELARLGVEAFAMIDKYYGRPTGMSHTRPPFIRDHHLPAYQYHHQQARGGKQPPFITDQPVLNSKDAAFLFRGIEIREYLRNRG